MTGNDLHIVEVRFLRDADKLLYAMNGGADARTVTRCDDLIQWYNANQGAINWSTMSRMKVDALKQRVARH